MLPVLEKKIMLIDVLPLGAGRDTGRSCIFVRFLPEGDGLPPCHVLLDCGIHHLPGEKVPDFSALPRIAEQKLDLDAAFITHAHIDHVGGVCYLAREFDGPLLMTAPTMAQGRHMLTEIAERKVGGNKNRGNRRVRTATGEFVGENSITEIEQVFSQHRVRIVGSRETVRLGVRRDRKVGGTVDVEDAVAGTGASVSLSGIGAGAPEGAPGAKRRKLELSGFEKDHPDNKKHEVTFTTFFAGHLLGAVMVLVEYGGKSVLYTGDYYCSGDRALGRADLQRQYLPLRSSGETGVDVMITETTYCTTVRDSKSGRESDLVDAIMRTVGLVENVEGTTGGPWSGDGKKGTGGKGSDPSDEQTCKGKSARRKDQSGKSGRVLIPSGTTGHLLEVGLLLASYFASRGISGEQLQGLIGAPRGMVAQALDILRPFRADWSRVSEAEFELLEQLLQPFDAPANVVSGSLSALPKIVFAPHPDLESGLAREIFENPEFCADPGNLLVMLGFSPSGTFAGDLVGSCGGSKQTSGSSAGAGVIGAQDGGGPAGAPPDPKQPKGRGKGGARTGFVNTAHQIATATKPHMWLTPAAASLDSSDSPPAKIPVCCRIQWHEFAAHTDSLGIQSVVHAANPGCVVLVHGSPPQMDLFANALEEMGYPTLVPGNGQIVCAAGDGCWLEDGVGVTEAGSWEGVGQGSSWGGAVGNVHGGDWEQGGWRTEGWNEEGWCEKGAGAGVVSTKKRKRVSDRRVNDVGG